MKRTLLLIATIFFSSCGGKISTNDLGSLSPTGSSSESLATQIYRSVGVNASAIANFGSSGNLSISGSTANFPDGLPDFIGIGDVIWYDSDNDNDIDANDSIVFIYERISRNQYTIKTETGAIPTIGVVNDQNWEIYRAYTSLEDAESGAINSNILVTFDSWSGGKNITGETGSDEVWNIVCYADGIDSNYVNFAGWTTSAETYINVFTPVTTSQVGVTQRHRGKWGSGYKRSAGITVQTNYIRFDGLSSKLIVNSSAYFPYNFTGSGEIHISNGYAQYDGTGANVLYDFYDIDDVLIKLWNNISITNSTHYQSRAYYFNDSDITVYAYNNTGIAVAGTAFRSTGGTVHLKNNLGYSKNYNAFYGTYTSVEYSASNDDTADNWGGTGNRIDQVFDFKDTGIFDYHLANSDQAAIDNGVDLSLDPNISITSDIDGGTRGGAWDIGADNLATQIFRSVGNEVAALADSADSGALSISGSIATFDSPLPNDVSEIGVGDVIEYDTTGNGTPNVLAFIHGRISRREFIVKNELGGSPTAIATDNDWSIFRAYRQLTRAEEGNTTGNTAVAFDSWTDGRDIVANNEVWNFACYDDAVDASYTNVTGWTTGPENYIRIFTPHKSSEVRRSQRHIGIPGTGYRRSSSLVIVDSFVKVEGIAAANSGNNIFSVQTSAPGGEVHFNSNFAHWSGGGAGFINFNVSGTESVTVSFTNNIAINDSTNAEAYRAANANAYIYAYNNTGITNGGNTFRQQNGSVVILKNNLAASTSGSAYSGIFHGNSNYNSSGDTTNTGGGQDRTSQTFTFVNIGAKNYHLATADTGAKNRGVDLSSDDYYALSKDIDGKQRTGDWDIGADELTATKIFRSVGKDNTAELADSTDSGALSITGDIAAFATNLPNDQGEIGVGDMIYYDSNDNGTNDAIAFIHERLNDKTFIIKKADGSNPTETDLDDSDWTVYRSYINLVNAETGDENSSIPVGVRNFDTWTGGKNISAATGSNEQWNIACYNDAIETTVASIEGWTTTSPNYLKIFTPTDKSEVAASQRHTGIPDTGYRFNDATLTINESYVHIDGLSIEISSANRAYNIYDIGGALTGEIKISNSFGLSTHNDYHPVFSVFSVGSLIVRFWNNIGINTSSNAGSSAFVVNDANATVYLYNNTGATIDGRSFYQLAGVAFSKNNLGYSTAGISFSGTFNDVDYNASNDDTADDWGVNNNQIGQTFTFIDEASNNFHLNSSDTGAMSLGTVLSTPDSEGFFFTNDIDNGNRSGNWDIGADQY